MELYTPIEEAGQILKERQTDPVLRAKIEETFSGGLPPLLADGPCAMIWRQIGTPDREFERFVDEAKKGGLAPVCLEYLEDKFSARNFTKYALTKLAIETGTDKAGKTIVVHKQIIDFAGAEKKKLSELVTLWGEPLATFHHAFLLERFPVMAGHIGDLSSWIRAQGTTPKEYYPAVFSLAIRHVVLFDDFDLLDAENEFVSSVILPAFEHAEKMFGVRPLVARLAKTGEHANDPYWWCYPKGTAEFIERRIHQAV